MKTVDDYEAMRRAYFLQGMSIREIAETLHHGRRWFDKRSLKQNPAGTS